MDGQYSWKRTEDVEIDFTDLLYRLCTQWAKIMLCALAFALVLGGYGWLKEKDSLKETGSDIAKEAELTQAEERAVCDAVRLTEEIRGLQTYLDSSVLMQLDPYHKSRYVMLYCIDGAKSSRMQTITESYLNYISNGGAADEMLKSGGFEKLDKNCLAELLSAYQKTSASSYRVITDDAEQMEESLFYTEVTGKDVHAAKKMAETLQKALKNYSASVKKNAGNHRLTLVNSMESITADSGLQSQQRDKKALLSSNHTNLKAMTDAFSKDQLAVYKKEAGIEKDEDENLSETGNGEAGADERSGTFRKYVLLGLFAGVFVYCGVYTCIYIFCDKIKSTDEMRRIYTFPVYGTIAASGKKIKTAKSLCTGSKDSEKQEEEKMLNRICMACNRKEIKNLYAVCDVTLGEKETQCLESMKERLNSHGIHLKTADAGMDADAWESLADDESILLICRLGFTTHRMIDDAMYFYHENGMNVLGAVSLL